MKWDVVLYLLAQVLVKWSLFERPSAFVQRLAVKQVSPPENESPSEKAQREEVRDAVRAEKDELGKTLNSSHVWRTTYTWILSAIAVLIVVWTRKSAAVDYLVLFWILVAIVLLVVLTIYWRITRSAESRPGRVSPYPFAGEPLATWSAKLSAANILAGLGILVDMSVVLAKHL